jgi:D-alanyl-lipoteichoic acid acyltransferase DltB (MBOAT superfamily)
MLFNSYPFIIFFLPITLFVFFRIGAWGHHRIAISWLLAASFFFYGWWNPAYLGLLIGSVLFNYSVGVGLAMGSSGPALGKKGLLAAGIAGNLAAIGYFKYANFFVNAVNQGFNTGFELAPILLPLAISFFTFQQIAYLVDVYRGETREHNFLQYCLFVTFFPQLIAGPIVHHKEMLHQFAKDSLYKFKHENFSVGITIFCIGLFKKVMIADTVAQFSTPVFNAASSGTLITFFEGWGAALAYTFQLYFDFSGYSDMAIGLGLMFGVRLPLNFNSPYKATSIIDFWRRWHMTLSRFMLDYLYIPLGGNQKGPVRQYMNLIITMLLGGLWHGAGWTFVIWGGVHGIYLFFNHAWRAAQTSLRWNLNGKSYRYASRLLTFFAVVAAWVMFRADNLGAAMKMYEGMMGYNGFPINEEWMAKMHRMGPLLKDWGVETGILAIHIKRALLYWALPLLLACWILPNTQQIMRKFEPAINFIDDPRETHFIQWKPNRGWSLTVLIMAVICLFNMTGISEFLYFQF